MRGTQQNITDQRVTGLSNSARPNNETNDRLSAPTVLKIAKRFCRHGPNPKGSGHERALLAVVSRFVFMERFETSGTKCRLLTRESQRATRSRDERDTTVGSVADFED